MKWRQCRDREDIIGSILRSAATTDGAMKTRIMYNSLLSYTQLTEYLDYLMTNKLLDYDRATKLYYTTSKGLDLLNLYNKLDNMAFFAND
ncbi:MAG TPA: winged helix-turn-helix domain-containing protein [Nitrososphaeraceae archaeon]|jgi:predicted transcriptional regulator